MSSITLSASSKQSIVSLLIGLLLGHIIYKTLMLGQYHHHLSKLLETTLKPAAALQFPKSNVSPLQIHHSSKKQVLKSIKNEINSNEPTSPSTWENLLLAPSDPKVWVVTPTFFHSQQYLFLTRTFQALYPVRHFVHWLVVIVNQGQDQDQDQDHHKNNTEIRDLKRFLRQFPMSIRLITAKKRRESEGIYGDPKGVEGRREALKYLRNLNNLGVDGRSGAVFFADDDNAYDSAIFHEIQQGTKTISIWPAGLLEEWNVITPILRQGKVTKRIFGSWTEGRKFPVDFAQFAINMTLIRKHGSVTIPYIQGYEEDYFLRGFNISLTKFQPLASNCTEILVWHTKSYPTARNQPKRNRLLREINKMNVPSKGNNNLLTLLKTYNLDESHDWAVHSARTRKPSTTSSRATKKSTKKSIQSPTQASNSDSNKSIQKLKNQMKDSKISQGKKVGNKTATGKKGEKSKAKATASHKNDVAKLKDEIKKSDQKLNSKAKTKTKTEIGKPLTLKGTKIKPVTVIIHKPKTKTGVSKNSTPVTQKPTKPKTVPVAQKSKTNITISKKETIQKEKADAEIAIPQKQTH